jgi:hypothetical protein
MKAFFGVHGLGVVCITASVAILKGYDQGR